MYASQYAPQQHKQQQQQLPLHQQFFSPPPGQHFQSPPPQQQQQQQHKGTLAPGQQLTVGKVKVTVEKYLSEGGFAHVYLVQSQKPIGGTTRLVLKRVAVREKPLLEEVRREVEVMKQLRGHPNIVNLIDADAFKLPDGTHEVLILMEFCAGGGIIDMMNRRLRERLTEEEILQVFVDICEGVAKMHSLSPPLIHRDLKVENILQSSPTLFKLCDFGSVATPRPPPSSVAGIREVELDINTHTTMQYRAPEMVDVYQRRIIDEKSDIWALGVLLYKLCYYTTPFEEHGPLAILNVQYRVPPFPVYSNRMNLLIGSMLQEHGHQRPSAVQILTTVHTMRGTKSLFTYSEPLKHSPSSKPPAQNLFDIISSADPVPPPPSMPDITPMRRGRPTRAGGTEHAPAAPAAPSPTSAPRPSVQDQVKKALMNLTGEQEPALPPHPPPKKESSTGGFGGDFMGTASASQASLSFSATAGSNPNASSSSNNEWQSRPMLPTRLSAQMPPPPISTSPAAFDGFADLIEPSNPPPMSATLASPSTWKPLPTGGFPPVEPPVANKPSLPLSTTDGASSKDAFSGFGESFGDSFIPSKPREAVRSLPLSASEPSLQKSPTDPKLPSSPTFDERFPSIESLDALPSKALGSPPSGERELSPGTSSAGWARNKASSFDRILPSVESSSPPSLAPFRPSLTSTYVSHGGRNHTGPSVPSVSTSAGIRLPTSVQPRSTHVTGAAMEPSPIGRQEPAAASKEIEAVPTGKKVREDWLTGDDGYSALSDPHTLHKAMAPERVPALKKPTPAPKPKNIGSYSSMISFVKGSENPSAPSSNQAHKRASLPPPTAAKPASLASKPARPKLGEAMASSSSSITSDQWSPLEAARAQFKDPQPSPESAYAAPPPLLADSQPAKPASTRVISPSVAPSLPDQPPTASRTYSNGSGTVRPIGPRQPGQTPTSSPMPVKPQTGRGFSTSSTSSSASASASFSQQPKRLPIVDAESASSFLRISPASGRSHTGRSQASPSFSPTSPSSTISSFSATSRARPQSLYVSSPSAEPRANPVASVHAASAPKLVAPSPQRRASLTTGMIKNFEVKTSASNSAAGTGTKVSTVSQPSPGPSQAALSLDGRAVFKPAAEEAEKSPERLSVKDRIGMWQKQGGGR